MEHWWEGVIAAVIVMSASLFLGFAEISSGAGKLGAYLSVALIPSLVFNYQKVASGRAKPSTFYFVADVVAGAMVALLPATIILALAGYL